MSIEEDVLSTLTEVTQIEELRAHLDVALYETHLLDSLKTVELMLALSERLGVDISPAEFDPAVWSTPAKIVKYFETRILT